MEKGLKRNQTMDVLKGLLIILVVLGHSLQYGFGPLYSESGAFYDDYLFRAIYTFHMPLFMAISGYFFYVSNQKPFSSVILSKLKYIGVPYVVYFILFYFAWWELSHLDAFYLSDFLRKARINLWFLSSLLLNILLVSVVTHACRRPYSDITLWAMCILTLFVPDAIIPDVHKFLIPFFILGYGYKASGTVLSRYLKQPLVLSLLTAGFVVGVCVLDGDMMVYEGGLCIVKDGHLDGGQLWVDVVRFAIGIVSSCWFVGVVLLIRPWCQPVVPFLVNIGGKTLAIYGVQSILFYVVARTMEVNNWTVPHNYLWAALLCAVVLAVCLAFYTLCDKTTIGRTLFLGKKPKLKQ